MRSVKTCERCGAEFFRTKSHGNAQWERRRFCSRKCVAAAVAVVRFGEPRRCACGCGEIPGAGRKYVKGHRPLKLTRQGYRRVFAPGHPLADKQGMVLEHRKVLHDAGVKIPPGWHVHHVNGVKTDNRVENLEVLPAGDHHRHHVRELGYVVNQFGVWPVRA